jgi:hypothetical protein
MDQSKIKEDASQPKSVPVRLSLTGVSCRVLAGLAGQLAHHRLSFKAISKQIEKA